MVSLDKKNVISLTVKPSKTLHHSNYFSLMKSVYKVQKQKVKPSKYQCKNHLEVNFQLHSAKDTL